jgi:hypothetical protein
MKAAMVLFALEESLGAYVTENAPDVTDIPENVRKGYVGRRPAGVTLPSRTDHLVQETYISELFEIAVATSLQKNDEQHLRRLQDLATARSLFDIRNAVCHPNRPFPECYWHRMAVIATDPAIERLQLHGSLSSFDWLNKGR